MTTPPIDPKALAEEALKLTPDDAKKYPNDVFWAFMKPLARAVLDLCEENAVSISVGENLFVHGSDEATKAVQTLADENQRLRTALEKVGCTEEAFCRLGDNGCHHRNPSMHDERCSYNVAREALERK